MVHVSFIFRWIYAKVGWVGEVGWGVDEVAGRGEVVAASIPVAVASFVIVRRRGGALGGWVVGFGGGGGCGFRGRCGSRGGGGSGGGGKGNMVGGLWGWGKGVVGAWGGGGGRRSDMGGKTRGWGGLGLDLARRGVVRRGWVGRA